MLISGTYDVGGLVGLNFGSITSSCSAASVRGHKGVGGLVGLNSWPGAIDSSFSSGSVSGTGSYYDVGGLVGSNGGSVSTSYSTGRVSSSVNGEASVGGLVGAGSPSNTIACFWDIQTSGHVTSAGGTGLTTAEMQDLQTFLNARWDFVDEVGNGTCDYWQIFPGEYPHLSYGCDNPRLMPEGLGTAEQPYLIRDARDLGCVWFEPLAHYRLGQSVDLSGIPWSMAVIPWFGGSFEGNGQVITNLRIEGSAGLGVFGVLAPAASVVNLGVKAVEITGTHGVGGLVGFNRGSVTSCYSSGSVSGTGGVGGLVGVGGYSSSITTSYSNSLVSGTEGNIGGLVGHIWGDASVIQCYSSGRVSGTYRVGGLVGYEEPYAWPEGSFWDTETSGQTDSYGEEGKTTAEMQTAKTFLDAGWDFIGETDNGTDDIWWIEEGRDYPRLWWELPELERLPVVELDAASFDGFIAESVVLVDFFATWCSHCTTQAPILEDVADQLEGRAQVAKLDVDESREVAQQYAVTAVPTLILFRDGVEVRRFVGVTSADVLVAAILAAVDSQD